MITVKFNRHVFISSIKKERKTDTTEHHKCFCHFYNSKKSILKVQSQQKNDCSVFIGFQRIILERANLLGVCIWPSWGVKPDRVLYLPGTSKSSPGRTKQDKPSKEIMWGTVQCRISYPFLKLEDVWGQFEDEVNFLAGKTAKKLPVIWPNFLRTYQVNFSCEIYNQSIQC